jgi:hypothetical protein
MWQPSAPQPECAFDVADAGLDADPPVAQPPEPPGPLQRQPGLAWGAGALQPDVLDPERFQGLVVGGGAEAAVADHRPGRPAGDRHHPLHRWDQLRASGGLPWWSWWSAMNPRSSSATSRV